MNLVLVANAAATWYMVGLIWFVQVVHYPLLGRIGPERHVAIATAHQRRTTYVVGPAMALEGVTTLTLLVTRPDGVWIGWPWIGALSLAVALGSTVLVQVPLHGRLAKGHDPELSRRLVTTNTIRTAAWTGHGAVAVAMLLQAL